MHSSLSCERESPNTPRFAITKLQIHILALFSVIKVLQKSFYLQTLTILKHIYSQKECNFAPKLQQVNSYHKSCIKILYNSRIKTSSGNKIKRKKLNTLVKEDRIISVSTINNTLVQVKLFNYNKKIRS